MSPSVSVVVNTLDRAASLERTLRSFDQLEYPTFEIVVVDGPSTDHTETVLDQWRGRIKVGRCPIRNLSMSRNIGIALAAGDIVAFIDDDAYPEPDWLDRLAGGYQDEEVAAVGGPVYDWTGVELQCRYTVADRFGMAYHEESWNPSDWLSSPDLLTFPALMGTNSSFRRDRLVALGGFDEEFEYFLDETDIVCRIIDEGWRVRLVDRGFVHHKFLPSSIRGANKAARDRSTIIKNTVYFALKHGLSCSSFHEVCTRLAAFAAVHSDNYRAAVDQGLLTAADLEQFERDLRDNFDRGLARYLRGPEATPEPVWFNQQQEPFLRFEVPLRRQDKRHVALLTQNYPPRPEDDAGRSIVDLAVGLARKGHLVRVVTGGPEGDRRDLVDGVWVHWKSTGAHELLSGTAEPAVGWDLSASMIDELRRIHDQRPVDAVYVAAASAPGQTAIVDAGFQVVGQASELV